MRRGLTAIIGGGGKSTLLRALAEECAGQGDAGAAGESGLACEGSEVSLVGETDSVGESSEAPRKPRVIVATSTKMMVPDWCPVLLDASLDDVAEALDARAATGATGSAAGSAADGAVDGAADESVIVCVGSPFDPAFKLDAPKLAWEDLAKLADYVLVEADGAKTLPLKAHAQHEPVIPGCANRVICVVGVDGIGQPISQACHRAELYAQLADASVDDAVTPEMAVAVLEAEGLHDMVLINKVETAQDWEAAECIASQLNAPVVAGSLWRNEFRCLR